MKLQVKTLTADAKLPSFANEHDAGMDLYANQTVTIEAHERAVVSTGIAVAIPVGYVGLVWDKSGMATKYGLTTLAGVIDAGYRGEVLIAIYNTSNQAFVAEAGKKIAQLLIQPILRCTIEKAEELPESERGEKGFGSSGE